MSMDVGRASAYSPPYQTYSDVTKKSSGENAESNKQTDTTGVIYEKGSSVEKSATYSINKKSAYDRSAIVNRMQQETARQKEQLASLVQKTLSGQASAYGKATDDDIWKTLASGNFKVDAATKAQAQIDIGKDGYWGVDQTSKRLFDFASALAGDDVEKMKKMQEAMEKGFSQAKKAWGGTLPGISQDTMSAANKLFEDYYSSKGAE